MTRAGLTLIETVVAAAILAAAAAAGATVAQAVRGAARAGQDAAAAEMAIHALRARMVDDDQTIEWTDAEGRHWRLEIERAEEAADLTDGAPPLNWAIERVLREDRASGTIVALERRRLLAPEEGAP
jgi:type II secretory pathway pseudopilin PulG